MTCAKSAMRRAACSAPLLVAAGALLVASCEELTVTEPVLPPPSKECTMDEHCPFGEICSLEECVEGCRTEHDRCPPGEICIGMDCHPEPDGGVDAGDDADAAPVECPDDMVEVDGAYCIDRYEASRPNATEAWRGDDSSRATSREGVLPWYPVDKATAAAACAAAGKRLCAPDEFLLACGGPTTTVYPYGDSYDPVICNSIDTYCACGSGTACEGITPCPYPHCYDQPPAGQSSPADGCGAAMQAQPTGSFGQCVSGYGAFDLSGNVWELVDDGTAEGHFRGGAYNCKDSETLHRCDYVATNILAKGFRCCW